jgi:hypothetical protein
LDLFQLIWKNRGCVTKKKVKKYWQYNLPTLGKTVDQKILQMGWNSSHQPRLDRLCDWNMCTLSSDIPANVLSCGHGYHAECFDQVNQRCTYCYEYLCDGIKYNCKVFQNTLSKAFDDNVGEDDVDLENQEDLQDNNVDEMVFIDENINNKLEEALELFRLCQE